MLSVWLSYLLSFGTEFRLAGLTTSPPFLLSHLSGSDFVCVIGPDMLAHAFNSSNWEAEEGGFLCLRPAQSVE